ncbi:sigma-54-dependent Fis family transcriptional regulator [Myxococcota bacterium]|jgi:DNA-binding NtrC family response regulator|nr:sigma-54-dependent Fis family transcriptional regulator [Myxococcota bacterium]MBP8970062.1 sigma-54-dependent Fis family transcriptional regulator [Myxococcota bacterium]HHW96502.1 sigma-54-dependent Fis family transcriptional regulator [Oligoflexales bacterium]HQL57579.1 sigma 54-interacting transcriptional regulator [Myxococcota bacterium]
MGINRILVVQDHDFQIYSLLIKGQTGLPDAFLPWVMALCTENGVRFVDGTGKYLDIPMYSSVHIDGRTITCLNAVSGPAGNFAAGLGPDLIGISGKMLTVMTQVVMAVNLDEPVIILGESGTGKELVAQALHSLSHRKTRPFVAVNMAAIPKDLVESELFGHRKGAFTGAIENRPGAFEMAANGSIFLDELAEAPMPLQAKLLRILESGHIRRLGGGPESQVKARIISATNIDPAIALKTGRLRLDLLERLGCLVIRMPPLRERTQDIPYLFEQFWGAPSSLMDKEALDLLKTYKWPGNVRELRNVIGRVRWLCAGAQPTKAHLEQAIKLGWHSQTVPPFKGARRRQIEASGLPRSTFYYRLQKGLITSESLSGL